MNIKVRTAEVPPSPATPIFMYEVRQSSGVRCLSDYSEAVSDP